MRRTAYALMGAGYHGVGGLDTCTLRNMTSTYLIPRLLYGLEAMIVTDKQRDLLETFFKSHLKRIQALPQRTANEAVYALSGSLPIEASLDIKTLCFFGKLIQDSSSILFQICQRQLATKSLNSNSWFIYLLKLTYKYDLPSAHQLLCNPPTQGEWKKAVKAAVSAHWEAELEKSVVTKSSLYLMDPVKFDTLPAIWHYINPNPQRVARVKLQTRLLSGTLTLQAHRSTFYKLCGLSPETEVHFLASCSMLEQCRTTLLRPLLDRLPADLRSLITSNSHLLTKLLLNPCSPTLPVQDRVSRATKFHISFLATNACFALCTKRNQLLQAIADAEH
jgi:hypothetical protein